MNILIILPRTNRDLWTYEPNDSEARFTYLMPLGLPYISAALKRAGFNVDVLNMNHESGTVQDIVRRHVTCESYSIIFTGGVSIFYPAVRDIIKCVRAVSHGAKIVVGGGMVSAQPEFMEGKLKPDYIIKGEGDKACVDLAKHIRDKVPTPFVQDTTPVEPLDGLPYPDLDAFGYAEYLDHTKPDYIAYDCFDKPRPYPILATRSCPYNCTFCYHTVGYKYRQRSNDNIMAEVRYAAKKYQANVFFFYDELFAYDKPKALDFCKKFQEFAENTPYRVHMMMNLRSDCCDEDILVAMKAAGASIIGLGLESASDKILTSMHKNLKVQQNTDAMRLIAKHGMGLQGSFIFGDTNETLETAQETLDIYYKNMDIIRGGVAINFIIPCQGTIIYKRMIKSGKWTDESFLEWRTKGYDFYSPPNLTNMSDEDFEKLKDKVFAAQYTGGYYAVPWDNGSGFPSAKCPYCGRDNIYVGVRMPTWAEFRQVGCRHCNGRFRLETRLFTVTRYLIKLFGFNRMRKLWGLVR